MKIWKIVFYILGVISWLCVVALMTFYFHARKILGYFPSYSNPDPKELNIYSDYSPFINWSLSVWFFSFFVWILLTIIYLIINHKNKKWKPVIFASVGNVIGLLLFCSKIFEWYMD